MSLNKKLKYSFLALFIGATLSGCGLDGDDGETGATGTQGSQGEAGAPGSDGADGSDGQDASLGVSLRIIGRAGLNQASPQGAAEIVQYNAASQSIYAINSAGAAPTVEIIDISGLTSVELANPLNTGNLTSTQLVLETSVNGKTLVGANSIAISGDLMAVAMEADAVGVRGEVLFYNGIDSGTPNFLSSVEVGFLPDMVTFTPDGGRVLVANEGEPNGDYSIDPEGSVSVIDILINGEPEQTADEVTFTSFNANQADLEADGVVFPNPSGRTINGNLISTTVAQDLEPEYITANDEFAYVALQENNGLAVIDLSDNSVSILGLGVKDWSGLDFDGAEDGTVSFDQYEDLVALYQPDTIGQYQFRGATFIVTANEGDSREYFFDSPDEATCLAAGGQAFDAGDGCLSFSDETQARNLTFAVGSNLETIAGGDPEDTNFAANPLGRLNVSSELGDDNNDGTTDRLFAFGGRSFTIWDTNGLVVYDSGDDFERISASIHGNEFNNDNDENAGDSRSANRGPEPEALAVGAVGDRTFAFIGAERMSGIFVYDVTNPFNVQFVDYVINRDTTEGAAPQGDLGPEGMAFVSATDSPTPNALLVVGNEVSGTVSVWEVVPN
ncbi:collagen-like protein [Alteromonadaceae bacterium M269]|nr:collagen-like protein [Alteromonadaceae bacterium M269]